MARPERAQRPEGGAVSANERFHSTFEDDLSVPMVFLFLGVSTDVCCRPRRATFFANESLRVLVQRQQCCLWSHRMKNKYVFYDIILFALEDDRNAPGLRAAEWARAAAFGLPAYIIARRNDSPAAVVT
ncbi:hypothetical protein EVAR_93957_1 [Eumeta japonica]|uniref:Uncharacterized protein n=1 Tax=Eumeta variegata TaxID=151549 RepID=A0A4C1TP85_EUMVA|nr:hypothetical protein EVAR_93957_1 [Eumeta japonica]